MMEGRTFFCTHLTCRVSVEIFDRIVQIISKTIQQIHAHSVTHQNTLDNGVFTVGRQRISRNQPAAGTEPVSQIIESKRHFAVGTEFPANSGN